jgi:hypothetical protein
METGSLVVVSVHSPREKFWGVLFALNVAGVTVRAVPVDSFEDWLRQFVGDDAPALLGAVTLFLPAHRLDRIELDETSGSVEGMGDRFQRVTGRDPREAVLRSSQSVRDTLPPM